MYISPRTLLGIIRISQAFAKINFRNEVTMNDVDESLKLMDHSFKSLRLRTGKDSDKRQARSDDRKQELYSEVMRHVSEICKQNNSEPISVGEIFKRIQKRNVSNTLEDKD